MPLTAQSIQLNPQKNYKRSSTIDSLKIEESDFSEFEIELRIGYTCWQCGGYNNKLFRLTKSNEDKWNVVMYRYYFYNDMHYDFENVKIDTINLKASWNESWEKILRKNYLNLPSDVDIKEENLPPVVVADGNTYVVEVLTKRTKRRMFFNNPDAYYEVCQEHKMECPEFQKINEFIRLLRSELNFDLSEEKVLLTAPDITGKCSYRDGYGYLQIEDNKFKIILGEFPLKSLGLSANDSIISSGEIKFVDEHFFK